MSADRFEVAYLRKLAQELTDLENASNSDAPYREHEQNLSRINTLLRLIAMQVQHMAATGALEAGDEQ